MRLRSFLRSPEFLVILAPFILYAPVLFGQAMFWGTPVIQFHPWHVAAWETLKSGHLPLWNPLSGMGAPLLANYQSALLYPPNWLYFLLAALGGNATMAWGMGLLTAAHLSLAGAGMVRLTRAFGLGPIAQTISGLAFGLSGYLVARAHFLSMNVAIAWLPWVLWAGFEMVVALKNPINSPKLPQVPGNKRNSWDLFGPHRTPFLRLTFFLAMLLLAGHAQTAWYTLLLTGIWLLFWTFQFDPRPSAFARILILFTLAGLAAIALSAVQLIPTAELLSQSQRAGGADYDFVMTYSFWPWRLLGLVVPGFFGSPVTGDYWGFATFWEDALYIGLLPFLLALRTIPSIFKKNTPQPSPTHHSLLITFSPHLIRLLWLLTGLSLLLALGQNTPLYPFLYRHIPTFNTFQAPARWTLWAEFSLALLAGLGAETWHRPVGPRARARTLRGVVIAVAVVLAALAAQWVMPEITPSFVRATALAGGLGIVASLFSLYAPKPPNPAYSQDDVDERSQANSPTPNLHLPSSASTFSLLVGLFVAFDLILAGWGLSPGNSLAFYRDEDEHIASLRTMLGDGRLYVPPTDEQDLAYERYLRFDTFRSDFTHFRTSLIPNLNLLDHLPSANNFDPLRPERYVRWMDALATASSTQQKQLLGMMGVTVIERYAPDTELGATFESFPGNARFQWVPCVWYANNEESAWNWVFNMGKPPFLARPIIIVEGAETNAQYACGEGDTAQVQVVEESANEIRLQVEADSSGWLFVADTWYPGWTAEVNGETAQIYRANYLFRTVQVPAGGGEVVMRYRPVGFWVGVMISSAGWLILGILALRRRFDGRN